MIKKITIYFRPVEKSIILEDDLDEREQEEKINNIVYDELLDEINDETMIDYWEE